MKKGEFSLPFLFIVLMIGALIGSVLGEVIASVIPATAPVLTKGIQASLNTTTLDLYFLQFPLGFVIKFNLMSVLGIAATFYILKKL